MFISARVPSRPHTFHAREKEFSSDKKEKEQPFSEMPPFACVVCQVSRVRKKEEKSIEVSSVMGGKKAGKQNRVFAFSLF